MTLMSTSYDAKMVEILAKVGTYIFVDFRDGNHT